MFTVLVALMCGQAIAAPQGIPAPVPAPAPVPTNPSFAQAQAQNTPPPVISAIQTSPLTKVPGPVDQINLVSQEYFDQSFTIEDILGDKLDLLPQDFKISDDIKKRVGFWLDIYTKYSSHFALIHDSSHPWIIYRVVDLRPIYDIRANRFAKYNLDRRTVYRERNEARAVLLRLAHKRDYQHLTDVEYTYYKLLEEVPGSRHQVFLKAAHAVREQRGQKDFYRSGLIYSSRYLSEMEQIFARYDLPVELVRLPLVESSFNEDAQSKVGASGIWQFMPSMGRHYLKISNSVDERNSPIKATEAAAKLMLSNFRVTHSWPLAITSYNHGAGGVMKACKRLRSRSIADLVDKFHSGSFSFASQNFYSEFMAALYAEKYQDKIFGTIPKYPPLQGETIALQRSLRARVLTDILGITIEELKLYNPDLKAHAVARSSFLPKGYLIRLPSDRRQRLDLFFQLTHVNRHAHTKTRKEDS